MSTHPVRSSLAAMLGVTLAVTLGACASTPPPAEQMAVATSALQRADTATTAENAPRELQIAKSKLAAAKQAETSKDYDRARQLADEAQVDAQVAELHAQAQRSRKAAQETQDAARVLSEEINRKTPR